jgi:Fe-S-cluster-containing hydrogenase component 2
MACSYEHTGTFNPSRSYIKVFTFHHEGRFAPYTCTQCDEAWCMRACPVDAITVDMATGAKVIHDDKCVGCKVCTIIFVVAIRNARRPVRPMRSLT